MADGDRDRATVDHPLRERLKTLRRELQREREDLEKCLKRVVRDVGKGGPDSEKSWTGKNAERWHEDAAGHRRGIRRALGYMASTLDTKIQSLPEKVTPEEAKMMRLDMDI